MEYRDIKDLKCLNNNPRTIKDKDFKILCESIKKNKEFFEARPLIVSNRTGELVVIAGNQRLKAAEYLGIKKVPTFILKNPTEELEKEITIRDNINNGEWDYDTLLNEWNVEDLNDWGLDTPTYKEEDFPEAISSEKGTFQQITFILSKEQAGVVNSALEKAKNSDEYKYIDTNGNDNINGNALFMIMREWLVQKK